MKRNGTLGIRCGVQINTQYNPLSDALSAYGRALHHHAFCVGSYRKYRNPTFRQILIDSASASRFWKGYILRWGKL